MKTKHWILGAAFLLGPLAGCAHHGYYGSKAEYNQDKAAYHHERAAEDWDTGHPVGAIKEKVQEHGDKARSGVDRALE